MKAIAAVDSNWGIGYKNELLVSIPADMRFFKEETTGKVVIMGKKTLESFPGGRPLKGRINICLTKDMNFKDPEAFVFHSVDEVLEEVKKYNTDDIYVIGGESIYKQFLQYCDVAYITKIDYKYQADAFFPNLDNMHDWYVMEESEEQTYYDLEYRFLRYEKK
jgi:dihydrofolate reductase